MTLSAPAAADYIADAVPLERALLASLLWNMRAPLPPLLAEEFALDRHRDLWHVFGTLAERGMGRDVTLVCDHSNPTIWSRSEALAYLAQLMDEGFLSVFVTEYAEGVRAQATRRAMRALAGELAAQGLEADEVAERLRAMPGPVASTISNPHAALASIQARWGAARLLTGLKGIDELTGLVPGKLVVLGGRTSHGKTAFMLSRAWALASAGVTVDVISLEETRESILARLLAMQTGFSLRAIFDGALAPDQQAQLAFATDLLSHLPLQITTAGELKAMHDRAVVGLVRRSRAQVVMVDYLQKIQTNDDSRAYGLERVLNALHQVGLETGAVLWINAQLGRDAEERRGEPVVSDLRDSGALEIIARQVWLLYWPWKHKTSKSESGGDKESPHDYLVKIAKNSDGPTGRAWVWFDPRAGRFYSDRGEAELAGAAKPTEGA